MALSSTRLSTAIYNAITGNVNNGFSSSFGTDVTQQNLVKAWCDSIASAVVNEFTANALVNVTSVSGVTAGAGVSGPGTGTIS